MSKITDGVRVRKIMCESCVFRPVEEGGIDLREGRHEQIRDMLLAGGNQLCHHDDNLTVCRGGRDYFLQKYAKAGVIAAPTDEALRDAMRKAGIEPRGHI